MNRYNPNIHHRKSIRLKGYNYAQAGLYFITICCQGRICRFGDVENGKMIVNDAGKMVGKWYDELPNKFPDIRCHEMVVMPNHFHCIIEIVDHVDHVGADLRVCPHNEIADVDFNIAIGNIGNEPIGTQTSLGEHTGSPLHRVVQWFKTMTTNAYIRGVKTLGWPPFDGKLWQRNYYEHIICNKNSYQNISQYIINNPAKWVDDKFYIK